MERLTKIDTSGWYVDDQNVAYDEKRRGNEINLLAAYEDTDCTPGEIEHILDEYGRGMTLRTSNAERLAIIKDIPTSELKSMFQKNNPMTLDELREMDGDKIFICYIGTCKGFYKDEYAPYYGKFEQYVHEYNGMLRACDLPLKYYGETWLAYRRKPEDVA